MRALRIPAVPLGVRVVIALPVFWLSQSTMTLTRWILPELGQPD